MKVDSFIKEYRILVFLIFLFIAIFLFLPTSQRGVFVTSVSKNSAFYGKVQVGETINWANEKEINSPEDLYQFDDFVGTFRFMVSGRLELINKEKPGLGITVSEKPSSNIRFGLDVAGGTKYFLKPENETLIKEDLDVLKTRISIFGLRETKVEENEGIEIETALSKEEIMNLIKEGKFEGKISRDVKFENNTGTLILNKQYTVKLNDSKIEINNTVLNENQSSKLENIDFNVFNITNDTAILMFTVFTGRDIEFVCMYEQAGVCVSRLIKISGGWQFNFQINVSNESAERFANITKNMKTITSPDGSKYLDGKIYFFTDDSIVTELGIPLELKGKAYTSPLITGFRPLKEDAIREQQMLKGILKSGALPTSLEIMKTEEIEPVLGNDFLQSSIFSLLAIVVIVDFVIYLKYRSFKILVPNTIWILSDVLITIAFVGLLWNIDISSIAGIIFVIMNSISNHMLIANEILSKSEEKRFSTIKQRIKKVFSSFYWSSLVIIVSIIPLLAIDTLKSFVITVIIGELISVLVTRPAFVRVVEKLERKE
jgi:preprotein translocase subunit SecD